MVRPRATAIGQRARRLWPEVRRNRWAYVFISPFYILFLVFGLFPPLLGLYLSFHRWDMLSPTVFVGLSNYLKAVRDPLIWKALLNTLTLFVAEAIPELALGLVVAYLVDMYVLRGRDGLLAAYFSPMVTSSVATAMIFSLLFSNFGLVNTAVRALGGTPVRWLSEALPLKVALVTLLLWRWVGYNVVVFLASLQAIPRDYYEAAQVDGANGLQMFFRITVPLVKSTILYLLVITTIATMQLFAEPRLLIYEGVGGMGGRDNSLLTMMMYLYENSFTYFRFGYASAIAYVMFVITFFASVLNIRLVGQSMPGD